MQPHEKLYRDKHSIIINNFIGGLAWALGATIGLAIIFAILSFLLKNVSLVPFVGDFISDVIKYIISANPQWVK